MIKPDLQTLPNVYYVSEFTNKIQKNMIKNEKTWEPINPLYVNNKSLNFEESRAITIDWLI